MAKAADVRSSRPQAPQGQVNNFGHTTVTFISAYPFNDAYLKYQMQVKKGPNQIL